MFSNLPVDRRKFVRQSLHATLAAGIIGTGRTPGASPEPTQPGQAPAPLPIIDTHQHLWDLTRFRLPWIRRGEALDRNYLVHDYREAAKDLGIVKAVYMEVDVAVEQKAAEAQYVIQLCQTSGGFPCAAVIGGRPAGEGFRQYAAQFRGNRYVKGLRQVRPPDLLAPAFVDGVRLLGELGLCFDICVPPTSLAAAARLVDACPATRFVLDHCGNPDPKVFQSRAIAGSSAKRHDPQAWRDDLCRLAERKSVICKISGLISQMPPGQWSAADLEPIVNHCLDTFGPDRVVFASDWPVCLRGGGLRQWVEALRQIIRPRPEAQQRKLLHDNAARFYGLA